jgi:hypothetical protein
MAYNIHFTLINNSLQQVNHESLFFKYEYEFQVKNLATLTFLSLLGCAYPTDTSVVS